MAVCQVVELLTERFRRGHAVDPVGHGHPRLAKPGMKGLEVAFARGWRGHIGHEHVTALMEGSGEGGTEVRVAKKGVPDQGDPAHAGEHQPLRSPQLDPAHIVPTEDGTRERWKMVMLTLIYLILYTTCRD